MMAQTTLHSTSPILKTMSHHQPRSCTSDGVDVFAPKLTFTQLQVVSHSGLLTDLAADRCSNNNFQVSFHIISTLFQHSIRLISTVSFFSFPLRFFNPTCPIPFHNCITYLPISHKELKTTLDTSSQ